MTIDMATNEELIEELMRRGTFRGIVLWQAEYKGTEKPSWKYRWSNCDPIEVMIEIMPQVYFQQKAGES